VGSPPLVRITQRYRVISRVSVIQTRLDSQALAFTVALARKLRLDGLG
jgi:hypothetical protein